MRILKFFLFSFLGLLIVGLLSYFFGREILLVLGSSMIKSDYDSLLSKSYGQKCAEQFDYGQESWTQIRFISDKEYNLEVVCEDFTASPIILESKKLPPLLFKKSSGSGFVIDDSKSPAFIELTSLGRNLFIYTDEQIIHSNYLSKPDLDYDQGPISSCQSYNHQCCTLDIQSGLGDQLTNVNDCPKSCYESCLLRPGVLSFTSRPALDDATRTVEINSGEAITFSYVLSNGKDDVFEGQISNVSKESFFEKLQTVFSEKKSNQKDNELAFPLQSVIDFGDEQVFQSENSQDSVDHIYTCQSRICFFQAKINVKDARGVLSSDNELAKMVVKVNGI